VEQGFERSEGTAKYADRAAHAILFPQGRDLPSLLAEALGEDLAPRATDRHLTFATTWFRLRGYGTGAALTYLLSLYDARGWRASIERGGKLDILLEDRVGRVPPARAAQLVTTARSRFGYDARRRELATLIRAQEAHEIKSVAEFLALAPFRMILELKIPVVNGRSAATTGLNAMGMTPLTQSQIGIQNAILYTLTMPGVSLTVRERPLLFGGDDLGAEMDRSTALLPTAPAINGRVLAPGEYRLDRLAVSGEGYDLTIEEPVLVTVTNSEIRVRAIRQ
jgi:hypothetical protein